MDIYEIRNFNDVSVVIFEKHNYALPVWGKISNERRMPLRLVTFDYHADTHAPLAQFVARSNICAEYGPKHPAIYQLLRARKYKRDAFVFDDVLQITAQVNNDEHIQTADWFGYIDSYTVICHLSEDDVRCFQDTDRRNYNAATYYTRESFNQLSISCIHQISEKPFILDFDLDYFTCPSCFNDAFRERISILINKADLITIARESEYCPSGGEWNCEIILDKLMALISECKR